MAGDRSTTQEGGTFPSIVNRGYISDYFLAYHLADGLKDLYDRWKAEDRDGVRNPRSRVAALSADLNRFRLDASRTGPSETAGGSEADDAEAEERPIAVTKLDGAAVEAQQALIDAVAGALGWTPQRKTMAVLSAGREVDVPVVHERQTASGRLLVVLGAVFGANPEGMVASKRAAAGTLLEPLTVNGKTVASTVLEAAQVLFSGEDAPDYILALSGAGAVLLDRGRWGEGVFIGANLDEALARKDDRPKGELAAVAGLFSADAIDPGSEPESALSGLLASAANASAGVSKELRHGMRRSVELIAGAVVKDREQRKLARMNLDPNDLTRQALRYLYRIVVLLYAEARPELDVVPANDADYQAGYSVERLRDMALVELHSEGARHANHIQQSLQRLFTLVNDGYQPDATLDGARSLEFPGLHSKLFSEEACALIDRSRIGDDVMQQVLVNLCFTREQAGRARQTVSYATLGINQLGAVYEGLMAYGGSLAQQAMFEIDNDDKKENGTWLVPASEADGFNDDVFVKEVGVDGVSRRVRYEPGDFVFRLASRDRERSASFYTPEVLTEFTVRHGLEVFEEENPDLKAADWLNITILEPALGSGAFANEAVNQVAAKYLQAAQEELGETIDPDRYPLELQRAKAHFAINQTYGVDLNATGVELAEVSLWLNVMHKGLTAPRFDARLRRGNSLIGARRAVYTREQAKRAPWLGTKKHPLAAPTAVRPSERPFGQPVGMHHFLLPGEGWGVAADAKGLKSTRTQAGLKPEWAESVAAWRKAVRMPLSEAQLDRLEALAGRVERAWARAHEEVEAFMAARRVDTGVWGASRVGHEGPQVTPNEALMQDPEGAYARLKLIMDAWWALWFWAPEHGTQLPSFNGWLDALELLLGRTAEEAGGLFSLEDTRSDDRSVAYFGAATVEDVLAEHPWLKTTRDIADKQGFFHFELEFAGVFAAGGFDLQVGNPPWVVPSWDEAASLAEHDAWWAVTKLTKTPQGVKRERKAALLAVPKARDGFTSDLAENVALNAAVAAETVEPELKKQPTNLYKNFITSVWRHAATRGAVALVHPEGHLTDPKAGVLRAEAYPRLRRHYQFVNAKKLFEDVHPETVFGVHIYSGPQAPAFVQAVNLLTPATLDRSLTHDGSGEPPGIQFPEGGWDLRPHRDRLVHVDETVLSSWVRLFDPEGTPALESRLVRPHTQTDAQVLSTFAQQTRRLADLKRHHNRGFDETGAKQDGTIRWANMRPGRMDQVVLQSAHIINGCAFAQEAKDEWNNNSDWTALDLETLPADHVPRTLYQHAVGPEEINKRYPKVDGKPERHYFRNVVRRWVPPSGKRTLQAGVAPIGATTVNTVTTVKLTDVDLSLVFGGLLMSIPYDYLIKVNGSSDIFPSTLDGLPFPAVSDALRRALTLRAARLSFVTQHFAPYLKDIYDPQFAADGFVAGPSTVPLALSTAEWSVDTPLRTDRDRWLALCELDALAALALGLTDVQLLQMYRSQFAVLRKYETTTVFDANGRQISKHHHNHGFKQAQWEAERKNQPTRRGEPNLGMWKRIEAYQQGDTHHDLGSFEPPFLPADREAAMQTAYHAFKARFELS